MNKRLDSAEKTGNPTLPANNQSAGNQGFHNNRGTNVDDSEVSIVAFGLKYEEEEDLMMKATDIVQALGEEVASNVIVTGTKRFRSRIPGRVGLVKISFQNVQEKVLVLRNKQTLRFKETYKTCT